MKRRHVHISVDDQDKSIQFYSSMFGAEPTVVKPDYDLPAMARAPISFRPK